MAQVSPRVLVVDDQPQVRALWCEFLRVMGCSPDEAETGGEALQRFEQESYQLVVSDLLMPGLSGWDVALAVRRSAPAMPIMLVSGSSTTIDHDLLAQPGVVMLAKPVSLSDFRAAVQRLLSANAVEGPRVAV